MTQFIKLSTCHNCSVSDVVYDSRRAAFGSLFVCLRGAVSDGHNYAQSAYDRGCRAFAVERLLPLPDDAVQYVFDDTRRALAEISAEFYGYPAKKIKIIGITGTKGKTSTATYIYEILNRAGHRTGYIGTTGVDYYPGGKHEKTVNSTPESRELHRIFSEMHNCGCEYVVMEVSSQAYKTGRVYGIEFDYAVFTNLSPDHIGPAEHADYDEYRLCKARLFEHAKVSVINIDDEAAEIMADHAVGRIVTCSSESPADCRITDIGKWKDNSSLGIGFDVNGCKYRVRTPGNFAAMNAAEAVAVAREIGVDNAVISQALEAAAVKGRFEIIDALPDVTCIIDYAHNEVSLRTILETLRTYDVKRIVCLFGSVGGKAEIRRFGMGKVAGKLADFTIVTSDNPDREDPDRIIADIVEGVGNAPHIAITDRSEAIKYAVENAAPGDVLLFAGKGHEDYQLIDGVHVPFCERELIIKYSADLHKQKV